MMTFVILVAAFNLFFWGTMAILSFKTDKSTALISLGFCFMFSIMLIQAYYEQ